MTDIVRDVPGRTGGVRNLWEHLVRLFAPLAVNCRPPKASFRGVILTVIAFRAVYFIRTRFL
jgi:hypothetical protein